jgi:ribosomal protein S12 methylthiotransferase accessory factor
VTAEAWRDLVSPRVGLVSDLAPQIRGAEEPVPPFLYTATLAHFDFRFAEKHDRLAAGKGWTERQAMLSALGEAVERYAAYHWDPRRTFLAPWRAVGQAAISPADLVLYSDEQYGRSDWPYAPWTADQEVTWIRGVELPSRLEVALPASLVYLVYPTPRAEDYFAPATSNGLAAGPSLDAAILSGLYELIERDALLVTWMNRLPAVEVEVTDDGPAGASVVRHYRRFGVEVHAFLMRTDQPAAVVMALASDQDSKRPARLIGMGCDLDPDLAFSKAVFELCQARPSESNRYREHPPAGRLKGYGDVRTLEDHPAFFCLPENSHEFEFLWGAGDKRPLRTLTDHSTGTVAGDLATCVDALTAAGHRVAYVDLTTPDVASVGMRVVRALAAGLQPIHFGSGQERLGGERLLDLPRRLGFRGRRCTLDELNPCPHPLA